MTLVTCASRPSYPCTLRIYIICIHKDKGGGKAVLDKIVETYRKTMEVVERLPPVPLRNLLLTSDSPELVEDPSAASQRAFASRGWELRSDARQERGPVHTNMRAMQPGSML